MSYQTQAIMNAIVATLQLAREKNLDKRLPSDTPQADYHHLYSLYLRARDSVDGVSEQKMSDGKLNRWLSWMQACIYIQSNGDVSVENFQLVNKNIDAFKRMNKSESEDQKP